MQEAIGIAVPNAENLLAEQINEDVAALPGRHGLPFQGQRYFCNMVPLATSLQMRSATSPEQFRHINRGI